MSIVYDPLNRPVLLQDANLNSTNQWNYIRYDAKGRAISQGIYTDISHLGQNSMQTYVNTLATSYGTAWYETRNSTQSTGYYTANIFPSTNTTPLAYAYYDNYSLGTYNYAYYPQITGELGATTSPVKGVPTMTRKATIGAGVASGTWLLNVVFYDKRGHAIQTQTNNHLNYTEDVITDYKTVLPDFTGAPLTSRIYKITNVGTPASINVLTNFTYDQVYRPTAVTQQYNAGAITQIAAYNYNEIGQLVRKNLGSVANDGLTANLSLSSYSSTTAIATNSVTLNTGFTVPSGSVFNAYISNGYLQSVDFRYNIRGQLLSINNGSLSNDNGVTNNDNNDLFGMQLFYDQTDSRLTNTPMYNGKLSAVEWMSKDASGNNSYQRSYKFGYDQVNRYTGETYAEMAPGGTSFNNNLDGFDEYGITYDANGNLLSLKRNSSTQGTNSHIEIDNLTYAYNNTTTNNPIS